MFDCNEDFPDSSTKYTLAADLFFYEFIAEEDIGKAKCRFGLSDDVQALSWCEPGGYDVWLHLYLC